MNFFIANIRKLLIVLGICIMSLKTCFAEDFLKVSVIIPVYNTEKYLKQCLDSVLNQTLKDIEIICIDDGSTDGSEKILEEYENRDERIVVLHQNNLGPNIARNRAIKVARGEYIGFVDSDDWIDSDFFEKLYRAAKKYNADAVCTSARVADISGGISKKPFLNISENLVLVTPQEKYERLQVPLHCYVWNKIYRKAEIYRQNTTFKNIRCRGDVNFSVNFLYHSGKIVTISGTYYNYRMRPTSITHADDEVNQASFATVRADLEKFARDHGVTFDEWCYLCNRTFYTIFGTRVLRVDEWKNYKKYYLFGRYLWSVKK